MRVWYLLLFVGAVASCTSKSDGAALAQSDTPWRKPGDAIDSILPMEEYERRFRVGLIKPTGLVGGTDSRDAVGREFFRALSARHTAALRELMITPAEFSWLVFPTHVYRAEPYALDPGIFWMQLRASSAKGGGRMFDRYGGQVIAMQSMDCPRDTTIGGPATVAWGPCLAQITRDGVEERRQFFGTIIEHGGRFKLLSVANDL